MTGPLDGAARIDEAGRPLNAVQLLGVVGRAHDVHDDFAACAQPVEMRGALQLRRIVAGNRDEDAHADRIRFLLGIAESLYWFSVRVEMTWLPSPCGHGGSTHGTVIQFSVLISGNASKSRSVVSRMTSSIHANEARIVSVVDN